MEELPALKDLGPVRQEEIVSGSQVSADVIEWLDDNWASLPDNKKSLLAAIGRVRFDDEYIEQMKQQGRM